MRGTPNTKKRQLAEVLFNCHLGYKAIAAALKVDPQTVKYWQIRRGSKNNRFDTEIDSTTSYERIRYTPEDRLEAVRAILDGKKSVKACSRELGACPKTIRQWIRAYLVSAGMCKTFGKSDEYWQDYFA